VLEATHSGTSARAVVLSLFVTKELPVSCSGLIMSFLHTCPEAGCWMQVEQVLPGDLRTCLLFEEDRRPVALHRVQMQESVTTFVTRGRTGK